MTVTPSPLAPATPVAEPASGRGPLRSLRQAGGALAAVGALLLRHWPVLLALVFLGFAARRTLITVAVQASKLDAVFGFMVFSLVPVAVMIALVLMLRVLSRSLPGIAGTGEPGGRFRALAYVASMLLPFIAVYASYGYFDDDRSSYLYEVFRDEQFNNPDVFVNPSAVDLDERLPFQLSPTLVAVAVIAALLRFLLGLRADRLWTWVGLVRAYLEVLWLTVVGAFLYGVSEAAMPWVEHRRAYQWLLGTWHAFVEQLGPLRELVGTAGQWFSDLMLSLDTVLLVPVAWLVVGTVVYGQARLGTPPLTGRDVRRARRSLRRWRRLPAPVRRVAKQGTANVREGFAPLAHGFRLMTHAGWVPMLVFCLLFAGVQTLPAWLWELERAIIGSQDFGTVWMPLAVPLGTLNDAITIVLQLCLVAATIDRVLRVRSAGEAQVAGRVRGAEGDPRRGGVDASGRDEVGHGPVPA